MQYKCFLKQSCHASFENTLGFARHLEICHGISGSDVVNVVELVRYANVKTPQDDPGFFDIVCPLLSMSHDTMFSITVE